MALKTSEIVTKVSAAAAGNLASFVAGGGLEDSGTRKDGLKTQTSTSGAIALNYNDGTVHAVTATGDITLTLTNLPTVGGIVVHATDWGAHTITLPAGTEFDGGATPTFTTSGTDILVFSTIDGGATITLLVAAQDVS